MLRAHPIEQYRSANDFDPPSGAILIYGTLEERSQLPDRWTKTIPDQDRYEIFEEDDLSSFRLGSTSGKSVGLRRTKELREFLTQFSGRSVYVDYTGLSHHVWMPILRIAVELNISIKFVYSEPQLYKAMSNPRPTEFFDLSEKIRGISPIPTFSKLTDPKGKNPVFVPLLGFEGTRFKHVIEVLQPQGRDVVPIVGVPGFQLDFPFHSYRGNADALQANLAWQNVELSDAACPFSLYETLERVQANRKDHFLQVSPIGTKPHALGAAMYAISNADVELVYDHPVRKKQRSVGAGRCHVFDVSNFLTSRINTGP